MNLLATATNIVASLVGNSNGLISQLLDVLLVGACAGIVYGMGYWFINHFVKKALAMTVWNGFFILVGGLIIINFLLGLAGHPLYAW